MEITRKKAPGKYFFQKYRKLAGMGGVFMELVGVWSGRAALAEALEARLGRQYTFFSGAHPGEFALRPPGLLVIAPDAMGLAGVGVIRPRVALVPGDSVDLAGRVRAASAVSYGLGRRNTLTLSSLEGGSVSVALQRELMTLSGAGVERQEWVLPYDRERQSPEEFLCLVGALLLLDQQLG